MLTLIKPSSSRRPVVRRSFFSGKPAAVQGNQEPLRAIAHDARNVVAALGLCCDLLAEPGVLADGYEGFAAELRAVASAGSALVEKLTVLSVPGLLPELEAESPIDDLAAAVRQLERPLAALAGPQIRLEMECLSCFGGVRLSHEGLTRILINLTRNAAEAMPQGGRLRVTVQQGEGGSFLDTALPARTVLLCVQDSGPGIPHELTGKVFAAGFTTKKRNAANRGLNRGLGLSIVRRLAEAAGGTARVVTAPGGGARFEVELPLIHPARPNSGFMADFPERANLEC